MRESTPTHWETMRCALQTDSDHQYLAELLAEGWEPFAVTDLSAGYVYHLRRAEGGDE